MRLHVIIDYVTCLLQMRLLDFINILHHSFSLKIGNNLAIVCSIQEVVCQGKVYIGQEVFVAAFSCNNEVKYGAWPILLVLTCKQGTFKDAALAVEKCH